MSSGGEMEKLVRAAVAGDMVALDHLIKNKVSISVLQPAFSALLPKGNVNAIVKLLKYGISANQMIDRDLPLNIAIEAGNFELVKVLVAHGANVNPKVNFIFFPLATIVRRILKSKPDTVPESDLQILRYLLEQGADASNLTLTSSDEIRVASFKTLHYVLRQHGWVSTEDRIGKGGPP